MCVLCVCFIFVLTFVLPISTYCSRSLSINKDLLTYLITYLLNSGLQKKQHDMSRKCHLESSFCRISAQRDVSKSIRSRPMPKCCHLCNVLLCLSDVRLIVR